MIMLAKFETKFENVRTVIYIYSHHRNIRTLPIILIDIILQYTRISFEILIDKFAIQCWNFENFETCIVRRCESFVVGNVEE